MTVQALRSALQAHIIDGRITLGATLFETVESKRAVRQSTGSDVVLVTNLQEPKIIDDEVAIDGVIRWWGSDATVELRYQGAVAAPKLRLHVRPVYLTWTFEQGFPELANLVKPAPVLTGKSDNFLNSLELINVEFIITSHQWHEPQTGLVLPPGLNVLGHSGFSGSLVFFQPFAGDQHRLPVAGNINLGVGTNALSNQFTPTGVELFMPLGELSIAGLKFNDAAANLSLISYIDRVQPELYQSVTATSLEATLMLAETDTELDVSVFTSAVDGGLLYASVTIPDDGLGLDKLAPLAGDHARAFMPESLRRKNFNATGLQFVLEGHDIVSVSLSLKLENGDPDGWPIAPSISQSLALKDIELSCRIDDPFAKRGGRRINLTVGGEVELGELVLGASLTLPSKRVSVWMLSESGVVGDVLALFTDERPHFPALDVDEIMFEADPDGHYMALAINAAGHWPLHLGSEEILVEDVTVFLDKEDGAFGFAMHGEFNLAGTAFEVDATHSKSGGWSFEAAQAGGDPIDLSKLITALGDTVGLTFASAVPQFTVTDIAIQIIIRPDGAFDSLSLQATTHSGGKMPLGLKFHDIDATIDVRIDHNPETGAREFSGYVECNLTAKNGVVFHACYAIGQEDHVIEASWSSTNGATLHFGDLAAMVGIGLEDQTFDLQGIEPDITRATFQYQLEHERLLLSAESKKYGDAFFVAQKPGDGWQFVFGINARGFDQSLPLVGDHLAGIGKYIAVKDIAFLISSATIDDFILPDLPALRAASAPLHFKHRLSKKTLAAGTRRIDPAVQNARLAVQKNSVSAAIITDFAHAPNHVAQHVGQLAGGGEIVLQLSASPAGLTLLAHLTGSVGLPSGSAGSLKLTDPTLTLKILTDEVAIGISGTTQFVVEHETITATGRLMVDIEQAEGMLDVTDHDGDLLTLPFAKGVHFDELGVELGIVFEPPGLDFGLQGRFTIGPRPPPNDPKLTKKKNGTAVSRPENDFALVLEMIEEAPNPQLLSFHMKEVDLPTGIEAFTNKKPVNLPAIFDEFKASDVGFYWAEAPVMLPDGTIAQPGFRLSGMTNLLARKAHIALKIDSSGIAGDAELDPIHWQPVVTVTGKGKGVHVRKVQASDGTWVRVDNRDIKTKHPASETRSEVMISPGGPVISVSTAHQPYLYATCAVSLFNVLSEELEVTIDNDGARFLLKFAIAHFLHTEFDCVIDDKKGFRADASFDLGVDDDVGPIVILGIDFGSIHLEVGIDLDFSLQLAPDGSFHCTLSGSFDFEGLKLDMPTLAITAPFNRLEELPKLLIAHISDMAAEIFKDLFSDAGALLEAGVEEVGKLAEDAGKEIGELALKAANEVAEIGEKAEHAIEAVGQDVADAAKAVEDEVGKIEGAIVDDVKKIDEAVEKEVGKIEGAIADVVTAATKEVAKVAAAVARDIVAVAGEIADITKKAAAEIEHLAEDAARFAARTLQEAAQLAQEVLHEAQQVVDAIAHEAEKVWNDVKNLVNAVGHAIASGAKKVWNAISSY